MFGLYLHIPFCQHKCSYCDFYSIERFEQQADFVDMLLRELELRADLMPDPKRQIDTVFLGGGTPSLLSARDIDRIATMIHKRFNISSQVEWTMECNPGTVSLDSLCAYKTSGVNRLSFGVQSFNVAELNFLERIHNAEQAEEAVRLARSAGFSNINIDMMFALPGQSIETFRDSMKKAVALRTEHISAYSLIFEEGTPLYAKLLAKEVEAQNEDEDTAMYQWVISFLRDQGYQQYEVSNFSRAGLECKHNLCYWSGDEYIAVGPSAHGYMDGRRYWNPRNLSRYLETLHRSVLPTLNEEKLTNLDRMFERSFLELRSRGIHCASFQRDFGIDIVSAVQNELQWLIDESYLHVAERLSLSAKGYSVCDDISLRLIQLLEHSTNSQWRSLSAADEVDTYSIDLSSGNMASR